MILRLLLECGDHGHMSSWSHVVMVTCRHDHMLNVSCALTAESSVSCYPYYISTYHPKEQS